VQTKRRGHKHPRFLVKSRYPTIVFLDKQWTEIWCGIRGTKTTKRGDFFLSLLGLQSHTVRAHEELTVLEVAGSCGKRVLGADDVERMRKGLDPSTQIATRAEHSNESSESDDLEPIMNDRRHVGKKRCSSKLGGDEYDGEEVGAGNGSSQKRCKAVRNYCKDDEDD
jgi:hypothetical protein